MNEESVACRLCLYNCNVYDDIFSEKMQSTEMAQKIGKYLYIEIKQDDEYTRTICSKCTEIIENFHLFSCQVAANQEVLLYSTATTSNTLNKVESSIILNEHQKSELIQVAQYSIKTENFIVTLQAPLSTTSSTALDENNFSTITMAPILNLDVSTNTLGCIMESEQTKIDKHLISPTNDTGQSDTFISRTQHEAPCFLNNTSENHIFSESASTKKTVPSVTHSNTTVKRNLSRKKTAVHKIQSNKKEPNITSNVNNLIDSIQNYKKKIKSAKTSKIEIKETIDQTKIVNKAIKINNFAQDTQFVNDMDNVSLKQEKDRVIEKEGEEEYYDSDASVDLSGRKSTSDDDSSTKQRLAYDNDSFSGFPKIIIKDAKLIIRGKKLFNLMSRFFRLECDLCNEKKKIDKNKPQFKTLSNLYAHYVDTHSIKGYVICCGLKLFKARSMAMHMSRHLQPDAFRCKKCDKIMTTPKILEFHMQNHLPERERPLACSDCPRRFSYSSALKAHAISHQPEHERAAHICDECGKSFSSPARLSTHMNVAHISHSQDYICHICARQFTSRGNLSYHLTTHQPRITNQVQCKECGKWLKNKVCLRKHMSQHSKVRYVCSVCEYSSLNRQCLRNHLKVQHSDVKPYSCETCGKTFKLRHTLIDHIAQHTGVRKFICEFCKRTFASSGNYYSHRKRMHPQELAAFLEKREEEEQIQRNILLAKKIKAEK